jgi:hypothetical protein
MVDRCGCYLGKSRNCSNCRRELFDSSDNWGSDREYIPYLYCTMITISGVEVKTILARSAYSSSAI